MPLKDRRPMSHSSVFKFLHISGAPLGSDVELEFQSPKLGGAQENEKVAKRAPGSRFSLTSWRCTRSSNSRPQNWRGAQEYEKVAKRVPGSRFSPTSWRYTRSPNSRPKNWRGAQEGEKIAKRAPGSMNVRGAKARATFGVTHALDP